MINKRWEQTEALSFKGEGHHREAGKCTEVFKASVVCAYLVTPIGRVAFHRLVSV